MKEFKKILPLSIVLILIILPKIVIAECTCDEELEYRDKAKALRYKIAAIIIILVASAIGVCIPFLGKIIPFLSPKNDIFFMIKAFAGGVILSTGFIHVLPDAFDNLTSPCLKDHPWGDFPFTGFVAMCSAMGTLMVDSYATSYFHKAHHKGAQVEAAADADMENDGGHHEHEHGDVHAHHSHVTHYHAHDDDTVSFESFELLRHRVISQVLELGIIVHSVIIGISVGASESPKTIRPLVAALTFHQFFEGIGLGSCITQAKFKIKAVVMMGLFFALTTPVGIGIGIGITNVYDESSPTALIVEGIFDAASAGILIYMALVDILGADFMHPRMQKSGRLQIWANLSLLLGAGCMSLLAKWA